MSRAYYSASLREFRDAELEEILGALVKQNTFDLTLSQRDAWAEQISILKEALHNHAGKMYLEYSIPRMGRRVDALVIIGSVIFAIEFKIGASRHLAADIDQVVDYALDLHNFHEGSHYATIAPILVASQAISTRPVRPEVVLHSVLEPIRCNADNLGSTIEAIVASPPQDPISIESWERGHYKPTPTIIEATLALYNGHSVSEISRSDASARNLTETSQAISDIISRSRSRGEKSLVLVTGVPGAGKTLVGLNIATTHLDPSDELYSVFLSGNGPLVKVLQEALARDKVDRKRIQGIAVRKGEALSEVKAFIQNVHHFRDEGLINPDRPPIEHVALFDEAQRAWSREQTARFMRERKNQPGFSQSEPEFLISCMDRHPDWATIVGLVGGGQEINTGEAGIQEWLDAAEQSFPHWHIYLSDKLFDSEYGAGSLVERARRNPRVSFLSELHLHTSVRSFRSEKVSDFVKQLLDLKVVAARNSLQSFCCHFPVVLTRDLERAKEWVRNQARGSERYGMVVSSQAVRLKPYAIDVRVKPNPVHWFLNGKDDIRSSYYMEDVATEFDIQGLELDWVCMAWDADFRCSQDRWEHWSFRGDRWQRIRKPDRQVYQKNAYRVLLTRARQGMVIFVPEGDDRDPTRPKAYYDATCQYLKSVGLPEL